MLKVLQCGERKLQMLLNTELETPVIYANICSLIYLSKFLMYVIYLPVMDVLKQVVWML